MEQVGQVLRGRVNTHAVRTMQHWLDTGEVRHDWRADNDRIIRALRANGSDAAVELAWLLGSLDVGRLAQVIGLTGDTPVVLDESEGLSAVAAALL